MSDPSDTIVAVSSPPGRGARALVRLSGPLAIDAVGRLVRPSRHSPSRSSAARKAVGAGHGEGALARVGGLSGVSVVLGLGDGLEVSAWADVYRRPRSFTREDVVEISLPGSLPLVDRLVRSLLVGDGVRWAGPGEFTLRAFLNGRIDLSQAEAVAQLISATDRDEARAARRALAGELKVEVERLRGYLTETLALVEAGLDFADENLPELDPDELSKRLSSVRDRIGRLRESTLLRFSRPDTFRVVFAGLPNAGKSSLLNRVLGRDAALVSTRAGTTRDPVRGRTSHDGTAVEWIDLPGILASYPDAPSSEAATGGLEGQLEPAARALLRRSTALEIEHADVVLWVVAPGGDAARAPAELERLPAESRTVVVNKVDLLRREARDEWRTAGGGGVVYLTSAKTGEGVDTLVRAMARRAQGQKGEHRRITGACPRFLVSAHQEACLELASARATRAVRAVETGLGFECAAVDLRQALEALGELSGSVSADDVLGYIFSRFCVGK